MATLLRIKSISWSSFTLRIDAITLSSGTSSMPADRLSALRLVIRASICPTVVKLASKPTRLTLASAMVLARQSLIFGSRNRTLSHPASISACSWKRKSVASQTSFSVIRPTESSPVKLVRYARSGRWVSSRPSSLSSFMARRTATWRTLR